MWPFKKYRDRLPLIRKKITSRNDLLTFNPSTATHLFSVSKMCLVGAAAGNGFYGDKIQCDYYKSLKGNYVILIRSLRANDRIGNVGIQVTPLDKVNEDYERFYRFEDTFKLIYDNYHLPIKYEEV